MKTLTATRKGIVTSVLMITLSLIFFYVLHLPETGRNQFLILTLYVAGILWSLVAYKKNNPGTKKIKDYFSEGFKTFIVISFLMAVYTFVFYKLNPQIMENGIKENNILVMKEGNHTEAEISENAGKLRRIFMPMMLTLTTIKYLLVGSLVSLAGGAVLVKR